MQKYSEILTNCRLNGTALMAFNLQNLYQINAAKKISEQNQAPLIIQFSERYLRFLNENYSTEYIIERFHNDFTYFHLDHCEDLNFIKQCIDWGFDSVMYDGSSKILDENIRNSQIIKEYAKKSGCLVEGELGKVAGVEDGFGSVGSSYANLEEIDRYLESTKIDLMALGIGNAHGFYETLDDLDMDILKKASLKHKNQLFVLHGGTGLPDKIIKEAIASGVVKINLSSLIKKRTSEIIYEYASQNRSFDEISFQKTWEEKLGELFMSFMVRFSKTL